MKLGNVNLAALNDEELILIRARAETEMRRRNIAFSVGDVGERLALDYFNATPGLPNLQLAPTGTKNVDALSRNGDRYSIKTVWKAKKTGTIYPDSQEKDKQLFEFLLIVRLKPDWTLHSIYQLAWDKFAKFRSWDRRMNAWYLGCSERSLSKALQIFPHVDG